MKRNEEEWKENGTTRDRNERELKEERKREREREFNTLCV